MADSLLTRALTVVDAVSRSDAGLRFGEVQALLGGPSPATVSKILRELTQADVIAKTAQGRYVVGVKALFWGKAAAAHRPPIRVIRDEMRRISETFGAAVNLFSRSGPDMVCLESITAPQSPNLWPAGKAVPLALPVLGSVFFMAPEALDDPGALRAACREQGTEDVNAVRAMIAEARRTGVQRDAGLFYSGLHRLSVPLEDAGRVTMVLGAGFFAGNDPRAPDPDRIVAALLEAKRRIEKEFNLSE